MNKLLNTLIALTLFTLVNTQAFGQSITVQGSASISVTNTQAKIFASVNSQATTADESMTNNNAKIQEIIDALTAAGINLEDIKTLDFSFNPIYNWNNPAGVADQTSMFEGYQVNNSISVVVKDISTVGLILDLIVNAGASRINSVQFFATDINTSYLEALTQASQDALVKAEALALASSVTLGKAIKITSNNSNYIYTNSLSNTSLDTSSASAPVILPGNNQTSAHVIIEYAIVSND